MRACVCVHVRMRVLCMHACASVRCMHANMQQNSYALCAHTLPLASLLPPWRHMHCAVFELEGVLVPHKHTEEGLQQLKDAHTQCLKLHPRLICHLDPCRVVEHTSAHSTGMHHAMHTTTSVKVCLCMQGPEYAPTHVYRHCIHAVARAATDNAGGCSSCDLCTYLGTVQRRWHCRPQPAAQVQVSLANPCLDMRAAYTAHVGSSEWS